MSLMHTGFYFILALGILIAAHEYGHFIVAQKLGVKVLRFSLGFGKLVWRYQKSEESTEFTLGLLPLGGYVKMVDEREGPVSDKDLPFAFNRQSLPVRSAIVFAGPLFNFLLAVLIFWVVFMIGETGTRPVLGPVASSSLAGEAGFSEGDEIISVENQVTPIWDAVFSKLSENMIEVEQIRFKVKSPSGETSEKTLFIPKDLIQKPELFYDRLGFHPFRPSLPPVIGKIEEKSAAEMAGLKSGDLLISADAEPIKDWMQWVEMVRSHADQAMELKIDREGVIKTLTIKPASSDSPQGKVGRIGAAVKIPEDFEQQMKVEYRLGFFDAFTTAVSKTWDYSALTVNMMGRMMVGKASVENLSGPISIAQYAGQSASMGLVQFLKFLALVSVSLGVLNLFPIPVLDGGHLMFFLLEAVLGRPVPEKLQLAFQQLGLGLLLCLMALAFFLDIQRLLA